MLVVGFLGRGIIVADLRHGGTMVWDRDRLNSLAHISELWHTVFSTLSHPVWTGSYFGISSTEHLPHLMLLHSECTAVWRV